MTKENHQLKIIFFGDIVGRPGRQSVKAALAEIKKQHNPDLIIGNAENSAHGKGVTEKTLNEFINMGMSVFTSGEHIYDKAKEEDVAADLFKKFPTLLKPGNFATDRPARADVVVDTPKGKVLVINLIGQVFFPYKNLSPWTILPEILGRFDNEQLAAVIIDFHAEATSEKVALGQYFDGKVSAVLGTHTHIPTADATILPGGTGYVTDVGMNGPAVSVLGMKSERSIARFLTGEMVSYDVADGDQVWQNYVILTIDSLTKKTIDIKHVHRIVNLSAE